MLELKISKLRDTISKSRIIDESKIDLSTVQILNKVKVKNISNNVSMEYTIVPESESDLKNRKISVETPVAKGLLGKKVGEKVKVEVPSGVIEFIIEDISR